MSSKTSLERKPLGPWREKFWPIYPEELMKFLPMVVIMFCVLFNYTVVRNVKDSLLVNAPHAGGHVLPWAKVLVVSPMTVLSVLLYAKLRNMLTKEKLYYYTLVPFIAFFLLFGFWMYPQHAALNASPETVLAWKTSVPMLADFFPVLGYWTFTLYYVMAELWGNIAVALLFWQFANQITQTSEAKRFYPLFGFWSNLGLVCAGLLTKYSEPLLQPARLPSGEKDFSQQVMLYSICVAVGGIIIGLTYWWMQKNVLQNPKFYDEANLLKKGKEPKPKLSIGDSIKYLMSSKYLGYITVLVLAYGVTINITEVVWKEELSLYLSDPITGKRDASAYNAFMGDVFIYTGIVTMALIMMSKNLIRSFGWLFSASLTPWVILITGGTFFAFLVFRNDMAGFCTWLGTTPVQVAVWVGLIQNTLSKGTKYALFDPTKEMTYIPLDEESKVKGKAAIDVIGGRFGKSGGSIIQMLVRVIAPKSFSVPLLGGALVLLGFWWLWAVKSLSGLYQAKLDEIGDGHDMSNKK